MSGTLVVMQPTVLPYAGYFNLMAQADHFVFHDDIQLEKRSWQTRNRVLFNGKSAWISLPIKHTGEKQLINETEIVWDEKWYLGLERKFWNSYSEAPFFLDALAVFTNLIRCGDILLADFSIDLLQFIVSKMEMGVCFTRTSSLKLEGKRTDRLIALCDMFQADEYLSPLGSMVYLHDDKFEQRTKTKLRFHEFKCKPYPQQNTEVFWSHLSILDVIANLGFKGAREYVS